MTTNGRTLVALARHLRSVRPEAYIAARCPGGRRSPDGDARRPTWATAVGASTVIVTPAALARAWCRPAMPCNSSRRSVRSPCTGSRPPCARASTRRSSASRTRWSVSSEALRSAASISSALRGRASARSSSAFRIESGVRSSWLASSTNRSSRSIDAWIRSSMAFNVTPSRVDLVVRSGKRQPARRIRRGDRRRLPTHPFDGAQRGPREHPPRQRDQDDRDRCPDRERRHELQQLIGTVLQRRANDHDRAAGRRHDRDRKQPRCVVDPRERSGRTTPAVSDRGEQVAREQRSAADDLARLNDRPARVGDLRERLVAFDEIRADVRELGAVRFDVGDQDLRARPEAGSTVSRRSAALRW